MSQRVNVQALLVTAALACATAPAAAQSVAEPAAAPARTWAFRVPGVEKVVFHGSVSHDAAGMGAGMMMYPAPNAVGLLAGLITHGLLNAGMRERQKSQMQASADLVLQPLEPVLSGFTNQRLFEGLVPRLAPTRTTRLLSGSEPAGPDWLVEAAPVFSMTQDRRAIVLDMAVRVFPPGTAAATYLQTVRVVSAPLSLPPLQPQPLAEAGVATVAEAASAPASTEETGIVSAWLEAQGRRLTDESTALFAESVDIALAEASGPAADDKTPHKTFRYVEGASERMERAQLVSERCGRRLIRTLRGWLMSIPVADDASGRCIAGTTATAPAPQ